MAKKILAMILVMTISLCAAACSGEAAGDKAVNEATTSEVMENQSSEQSASEYFSERDFDASYDETSAVKLQLSEQLVIDSEGTYILSGQIDDGMVIVEAAKTDKVQLVLDNVSINSGTSAAIYVKQADKVFITLADGSENKLSNDGSFVNIDDNNIDAVIFSKDDLSINGSGALIINSPAGHGIVVKDSLCICGGTFDIAAASNGLEGKDSVCIAGGSFVISAEKDGIQADNDEDDSKGYAYICGGSFDIDAGDDGISTSSWLLIEGGEFEISCGGGSENSANQRPQGMMRLQPEGMMGEGRGRGPGGEIGGAMPPAFPGGKGTAMDNESSSGSMRGIKADGDISIAGGSFVIDSADDSIHSNAVLSIDAGEFEIFAGDDGLNAEDTIFINGGKIDIVAYGDGLDANGNIEIMGGSMSVCGPLQGDTSTLDFESSAVIRGGSFLGTGSAMMARTFTASEQGLISLNVGQQSAGTEIKVSDSDGNIIISFCPELDFCVAIISAPELVKGESYTVSVGEESGEFAA